MARLKLWQLITVRKGGDDDFHTRRDPPYSAVTRMKLFFPLLCSLLLYTARSFRSHTVPTLYGVSSKYRGQARLHKALPRVRQVSVNNERDNTVLESPLMKALKAADIPNKLTLSRMLAIPLFCASFQLDCVSRNDFASSTVQIYNMRSLPFTATHYCWFICGS